MAHGWLRCSTQRSWFCPPDLVCLLPRRVGRRAKRKFERLARHALDERTNDPAKARGNGASERNGLDLDHQAAVAFFIAPIGVQPPEKAVPFAGPNFALTRRAWRIDLGNLCAARNAVAVLRVERAEAHVISRVEDDGDHVMLAHTHFHLVVVPVLREYARLDNLWCE